jgi:large subunit ribosomal protein L6
MEKIIDVPEDVDVSVVGRKIVVKGKKGMLEKDFEDPRFDNAVSLRAEGGRLTIKSDNEGRKMRAMIGTIRAHVENMVRGVQNGYKYTLKIVYTHFPMTVAVEKGEVHIKNFLGEKGARIARIKGDVQVSVDKDVVIVTGLNIEDAGQTAANIEKACHVTKRDRRIFQDGIYIEKKAAANR